MRHYNPYEYSDEERSDGEYYSSESPEETDSEYEDYREMGGGPGRGYHVLDEQGAVYVLDSESPSEGDTHESESETETDDYSDRYVPEGYESGSTHDRDSHHTYGDPYDGWDDYDDDDFGDYDGLFTSPVPIFRMFMSLSSQTGTLPIIITRSVLWRNLAVADRSSFVVPYRYPKHPSLHLLRFYHPVSEHEPMRIWSQLM